MSEPQSHSNRLTALDGLRGLSSLLVLLSHLKLETPTFFSLIHFLPLRIAIRTILNMGIISVGYFFILCGFLMVLLYESPQSYIGFVQKRYFRIFSVFIVAVCISFGVVTLGIQGGISVLALLVLTPILLRLTYSLLYVLTRQKFLLVFFLIIISSQVVFAFINYFIVFRIGPQEFYSLPKIVHTSFTLLTNASLTFIFGDYIPMLDGGYWSLVTEVMFYLIYPLVAWLLITPIKRLSKRYWILWYFASMLTLHGLLILFKNLLGFETSHIHFAHFFTVGMMIALAYKTRDELFMKLLKFFETWYGQVASLLCYLIPLFFAYWVGLSYDSFKHSLVAYAFAPLMGLAATSLIAQRNILARLFNTRLLVALGAISFPLYVIHSPIVHVFWNMMRPDKNAQVWWMYVSIVISISLLCAYYISRVVESLYFTISSQSVHTSTTQGKLVHMSLTKLFLALAPCVMIVVFIAFQKDFSIFTLRKSHTGDTLKITNTLRENSVMKGEFKAHEDRLGIVMMNVVHVGVPKSTQSTQEDLRSNILIFRIRQKGSKEWYHESQHIGWKISSTEPYPFGFPEIQSSTNKWYEFELESVNASPSDYVSFPHVEKSFQSVHKLSKTTILREPTILISIVANKVYGAFRQTEAQVVLVIYLFTAWFVWFIRRKAAQAGSVS